MLAIVVGVNLEAVAVTSRVEVVLGLVIVVGVILVALANSAVDVKKA